MFNLKTYLVVTVTLIKRLNSFINRNMSCHRRENTKNKRGCREDCVKAFLWIVYLEICHSLLQFFWSVPEKINSCIIFYTPSSYYSSTEWVVDRIISKEFLVRNAGNVLQIKIADPRDSVMMATKINSH